MVRTTKRFHVPVTITDSERNTFETFADFDSCAEVDVVSIQFVRMHHFKQAQLRAPNITGVTDDEARTYGVWEVPLTLRDSRGAVRRLVRPCVGIDRDPRLEVLLYCYP
jgi:hypothetical protein